MALFLDLSKAFDTIEHSVLINKLQKYGVRGIPLDFIKNYLSGRSQLVSFNGRYSELRDIKCGVPQGSILGPFLFSLYINDIYKCAPLLKFFLFADDTSLLYHSKSLPFLITILNQELKKLKLWLEINKLTLNLSKTNYIIFKNNKPDIPHDDLVFGDQKINKVQSVTFWVYLLIPKCLGKAIYKVW